MELEFWFATAVIVVLVAASGATGYNVVAKKQSVAARKG